MAEVIEITSTSSTEQEEERKWAEEMAQRKKGPKKLPPPPPRPPMEDFGVLTCKICLQRKIDLIVFPCSHACICQQCYEELPVPKKCPICRRMITRNTFVIFPN